MKWKSVNTYDIFDYNNIKLLVYIEEKHVSECYDEHFEQ